MNFNLVIVNSKIIVSSNSFSYCENRSIYTPLERFTQTQQTIESIKKYIPNHYIIMIDNSILPTEMYEYFNNNVNVFLNPTDDDILNSDTDINPSKAISELAQLRYVLEYVNNSKLRWINLFKICGRYTFNDQFNYNHYNNDYNVFKHHRTLSEYKQQSCYFTCFYKISKSHYNQYFKAINKAYIFFKLDPKAYNQPIELYLCKWIEDKKLISILGLKIICAVDLWIEDI